MTQTIDDLKACINTNPFMEVPIHHALPLNRETISTTPFQPFAENAYVIRRDKEHCFVLREERDVWFLECCKLDHEKKQMQSLQEIGYIRTTEELRVCFYKLALLHLNASANEMVYLMFYASPKANRVNINVIEKYWKKEAA